MTEPFDEIPGEITVIRQFARRLKEELQQRRWTRGHFAKLTGIPQPVIGRYMNGESLPGKVSLRRMADALEVPLEQLEFYAREIVEAPGFSDKPAFRMLSISRSSKNVLLEIYSIVPVDIAIQIGQLLNEGYMSAEPTDEPVNRGRSGHSPSAFKVVR